MAKHHYAIELAKRGNTVYFLNPPDQTSISFKDSIEVSESEYKNLFLIKHRLFFPYWLKFKAFLAFHWLMSFHITELMKTIGKIDIVWSFDIGNLYPLGIFKNAYKIFHPVDEPLTKEAILSAAHAQIILSVTKEILSKYENYDAPKYLIGHGVSPEFISPTDAQEYVSHTPLQIGLSGNLMRPDIDRETLIKIITENKDIVFHFWGSFRSKDSNIGGAEDASTQSFIASLEKLRNVKLHGSVDTKTLASAIRNLDGFLICYDVQKDQSRGTNYHKVLEYLAVGKVIISNNITSYHDAPDLVQMVNERNNNISLPALFRSITDSLSIHNSQVLMQKRIKFAAENTYKFKIDQIQKWLEGKV